MLTIDLPRYLTLLGLGAISCCLLLTGPIESNAKDHSDPLPENLEVYSRNTHLDFSRVTLWVDAPDEYRNHLYARALSYLKDKKVVARSRSSNPSDPIAILRLFLRVSPAECQGKVFYQHKVELHEPVIIPRVAFLKDIVMPTWFYGQMTPSLVNVESVSREKLEADLDELIHLFVLDYLNAGNLRVEEPE